MSSIRIHPKPSRCDSPAWAKPGKLSLRAGWHNIARVFVFHALILVAIPPVALTAEEPEKASALVVEDLDWPKVELKNGSLSAIIAVPDSTKGFYNGVRFDRSGFLYRVQAGNLRLFGPWKTGFQRGSLDAVTGAAGEFGMESPLGYGEAKPGEAFVKIGVGHLKRLDASAYSFTKKYEIVNPGTWILAQGSSFFEATQELSPLRGWAYRYRKRITLSDPQTITITYWLKNTGKKSFSTDYYAHNLLVFNDQPVSAGDRMEILADLAGPKLYEPARLAPRTIAFEGPIIPGKGYWMEMPLPLKLKNPVLARMTNQASGASVTLSTDASPFKLVFYAHDKALCAEPFVKIDLASGEEMTWTDTYQISPGPTR